MLRPLIETFNNLFPPAPPDPTERLRALDDTWVRQRLIANGHGRLARLKFVTKEEKARRLAVLAQHEF